MRATSIVTQQAESFGCHMFSAKETAFNILGFCTLIGSASL